MVCDAGADDPAPDDEDTFHTDASERRRSRLFPDRRPKYQDIGPHQSAMRLHSQGEWWHADLAIEQHRAPSSFRSSVHQGSFERFGARPSNLTFVWQFAQSLTISLSLRRAEAACGSQFCWVVVVLAALARIWASDGLRAELDCNSTRSDEDVGLSAKFLGNPRRLTDNGRDHRDADAAALYRLNQGTKIAVAGEQQHFIDTFGEIHGVNRELDVHVSLHLAHGGLRR